MIREEAIEFSKSGKWKEMSDRERVELVLTSGILCMPIEVFMTSLNKAFGRPVYTHELAFNWDGLIEEFYGRREAPSLDEIIELIPEEKRILINA